MRIKTQLFVIVMAALLAGCQKEAAPVKAKQEGGAVTVKAGRAQARDIQRIVESIGTLYPYEEAVISAEVEGKAQEVKFDLGDVVEQGAILVRINDEEARLQLAEGEAQLRQSLEKLGLANEGDTVKDITQTPEVRRARAELTQAEQRFRRAKSLFEQGIGPKVELDQATANYQALQAAYETMTNQTRNMIREVERNRAAVELLRKKLRDTTVRAPFRALIKERQVSMGQIVRPNTSLFTLVKIDPIRLRLEIPERMAPWIKVNQSVQVSLEAFENRKFQGRIWRISPTVDMSKRTFVAEALIDNNAGELKPGSYARAKVPTSKTERVTVIPQRAVFYNLGSNKAFVVKNGVVEAREVKLGDRFETDVEILEGVEDGDTVALSQLARLDTGSKVKVAE